MRWLAASLATVVLALPARAECPQSSIGVGCFDIVPLTSTAPTSDADGALWSAGTPCTAGCYDAPNGTLHAETTGSIYYPTGCFSNVQLIDDYQLVGGTPGATYPFQAILAATGTITGVAGIALHLSDPTNLAGEQSWSTPTPGSALAGAVTLPLSVTAGTAFRLAAEVDANGHSDGSEATIDAVLHFAGLPHGVSVTSCRAYNLAVPARRASWGEVKSTYR